MSFQRITTIGSMPWTNSDATPSRSRRSPSFFEPMDLRQVGCEILVRVQAAQRADDLPSRADEHLGEFHRLLHRRLDAVETELGGGLLGVVDDVIHGRRQRIAVSGIERPAHAAAPVQPVDDVVSDAIALALTRGQVFGQRRVLGELGQQLAQQFARVLDVAAGLFDERGQARVDGTLQQAHL